MKRVKQIVMMAFASLLAQCVWAELTTDFLYTGSGNGSTTGWITSWDGEPFADARRAIGPGNTGFVFAADHVTDNIKWHPWKNYQVPATFSLALYTDLECVFNSDGQTAVLWAAGTASGNRAILYKRGNKVGVATNGGDVETDVPTTGGYHLYTVTYTSDKITLTIDNGTAVEKTGTFERPNNGFQIGGIFQGVGSWENAKGLPVAAMIGFNKVLSVDDMTELTTTYPATQAVTGNYTYNNNGGKIFVGSMQHTGGHLEVNRGTLVIPVGARYEVPSICFGNVNDDNSANLDLAGELIITGTSSRTGAGQSGTGDIRQGVKNSEGGFLAGEWNGTGTFNISGTLDVTKSYFRPVHSAKAQTFNIKNGGVLKVKGINATPYNGKAETSHVFNIEAGGTMTVNSSLNLGTTPINIVVAEGGVFELAECGNETLNNSVISGITCNGAFRLTGTNYVKLPTSEDKLAKLAAFAEINNNLSGTNGQLLMTDTDKTYTIGSLSGSGGVRGDWAGDAARTLKINMHKSTTWSGCVRAGDGNAARLINIIVASDNGSTLTMSGNHAGNNARPGVLTVEQGATVDLTGKWGTAGFVANGTLNISGGEWVPTYMVKGTGTINWAGTDTFSVNAADGEDALILDGTTINQTAGTLSLRAPGNRTDDSHPENIGYINNATITSSSTLSCSGKIGVKGACSITKTAGDCSISTIELSEAAATLVLNGVTMTVTSYDVTKRVVTTTVAGGTKYSLETIQPEPPTPTEGGITPSIPGADTIEITVATGPGEATISGTTIPLETGLYTVKGKVGDTVVGTQSIGVVAAKAAASERVTTAVAVPFKGKTVATLLNTACLSKDDTLMAWIGGKYEVWMLDADKNWVEQTTHAQSGNHTAPAAATTALKCGQAVWVTTAGQIVTFGDTAATGDTVEVTTGHNLLGSIAYTEAVPQTAAENDQVQLIGETDTNGNEVISRYNKTATGWESKIQKTVYDEVLGMEVDNEEISNEAPMVKPGRGYWLIRK